MTSKRRRRRPTLAEFDLASIREIKRKARWVVKKLEEIERYLLKFRRDDNRAPTPEERDALRELHEGKDGRR